MTSPSERTDYVAVVGGCHGNQVPPPRRIVEPLPWRYFLSVEAAAADSALVYYIIFSAFGLRSLSLYSCRRCFRCKYLNSFIANKAGTRGSTKHWFY